MHFSRWQLTSYFYIPPKTNNGLFAVGSCLREDVGTLNEIETDIKTGLNAEQLVIINIQELSDGLAKKLKGEK